ncbi:MAG: hypothetical protein GVY28_13890 [Alphaproteobacteria bacterium]|jgi:hypothetical protein|nr:hypothetical protein [Alphaproteobacteria bacterium]
MTRVLASPRAGVLLSDQGADRLDLLGLPGCHRTTFFDATNAAGLPDPTGNVFTLHQAADRSVFIGDGDTDAVYRLADRNGDGDALDAGEATGWFSDAGEAAGLSLPTPNGLAQGPDGAIYIVNAGVGSQPTDAIYRTEDLKGDGDAEDAGEARLWLDLGAISATSAPFELSFVGEVAYLLDPNGSAPETIWRIEDRDGSGRIAADEVTPFITSDQTFGAPLDFAMDADADGVLVWEWLDLDTGVHSLVRLTDTDGSGAIDAAGEAAEVWTSTLLPDGIAPFAGFSVATDGAGRVALTSNGGAPGEDFVALLEDRNSDGDFLDAGETQVLGSRADDPDGFDRPRAVAFYEGPVAPAPTLAGAGNHYSLFLDPGDGVLYAAGENILGQLAQGTTGFDVPAPLKVALPAGFEAEISSVSAGLIHGAFLTDDGDVYTWGFAGFGRLGLGEVADRQVTVPRKITGDLDAAEVRVIDMGNGASFAITADGTLWAWGQNSNGQLGLGDREAREVPTAVEALSAATVVAVSSGTSHTLALTADSEVFAWGAARDGQLGAPDALDSDGDPVRRVESPVTVEGLPEGVPVVAVTADTKTSYAVLADGRVFGWGEGEFGQLAQGTDRGDGTFLPEEADVLAPVQIAGLPETVVDVKGGARWAAALTEDGDVWLWGPNDEGPTGGLDGAPEVVSEASFFPTKLAALDTPDIVEIQTGPNHLIAVTDSGAFYTFGANSDGRLGYPTDGLTTDPAEVPIGADTPPWLVAATPGDNDRDVAPDTDLVLAFDEAVSAGPGAVRLVNRGDATDVIEVDASDTARVAFDGDEVTIDIPGLLRPDARYAVEIEADAFRDSSGQFYAGLSPEDASRFDFGINEDASVFIGDEGPSRIKGSEGDDLIAGGAGRANILAGGEGGDTFVFGLETENGAREFSQIRDFDPAVDAIDLGGADVARVRETPAFVALSLKGDGDAILIRGADSVDDIQFA